MMGKQPQLQSSLFYIGINIDKRVRANHPLRRIRERIDFDFSYNEVKDRYGTNGNVSVPPPVILKLMLLLVLYNVRSERELMDTLPERLDWLWFLDYDLDSEIPNDSILSKARKKWGVKIFQNFFELIVLQCVEAGMVNGKKIFVDSSLIDANASNNSVIDTKNLKHQLYKNYKKLESRLEDQEGSTDPDAAIVNRGKPKLSYQVHRAVEGQSEIITATDATPGDVNEAHLMIQLLEQHKTNTSVTADTIVADSKYGRTVKRHLRQSALEMMREASRSPKAKRDIKTRQHLMERSFARGTRYGFDQARWRGLWRMRIQEYLTCAIQNIQVLIKHVVKPTKSIAVLDMTVKTLFMKTVSLMIAVINSTFCDLRYHEAFPSQRTYCAGSNKSALKNRFGQQPVKT